MMRAILPLLFVNGYPTSLNKMSICELERFIPFMVQCSLSGDQIKEPIMPKWWPKDIPYPKAFAKFNKEDEMWKTKLQNLIISCYTHHDCAYLLRFCTDLSKHPKAILKFVNNWDNTTSLYNKNTGKLLVTFRNENIMYDKIIPARKRKWLKPDGPIPFNPDGLLGILPSMVEEDPVDIYLCDKCDIILHSFEEMKNHEIKCEGDFVASADCQDIVNLDQENFLNYFKLTSQNTENNQNVTKIGVKPPNEGRKREARTSIPHALLKCPAMPFSSPAGIFLAKRCRHTVSDQTHTERRERTERYCEAFPLPGTSVGSMQDRNFSSSRTYPVTFRKSSAEWKHTYKNPKKVGKFLLNLSSQLKYVKCRPASVKVKCTCEEFSNKASNIVSEIINLCSSDEEDSTPDINSQLITLQQS
ncbi:uncharacterized protein LOC113375089 [Ctenocephalides felis]|uniref:uncharacterized protein LOC113375089 n=1 Tax=Ctenocephalides felis TaxID=7515 RepID=UPI000E6E4BAE|nr:uncharacterized protein LOC113375089 [Ctenocephalides felis]